MAEQKAQEDDIINHQLDEKAVDEELDVQKIPGVLKTEMEPEIKTIPDVRKMETETAPEISTIHDAENTEKGMYENDHELSKLERFGDNLNETENEISEIRNEEREIFNTMKGDERNTELSTSIDDIENAETEIIVDNKDEKEKEIDNSGFFPEKCLGKNSIGDISVEALTNELKTIQNQHHVRFSLPNVLVDNADISVARKTISLENVSEMAEKREQKKFYITQDKHNNMPKVDANEQAELEDGMERSKRADENNPEAGDDREMLVKTGDMEIREQTYMMEWEKQEISEVSFTRIEMQMEENVNIDTDTKTETKEIPVLEQKLEVPKDLDEDRPVNINENETLTVVAGNETIISSDIPADSIDSSDHIVTNMVNGQVPKTSESLSQRLDKLLIENVSLNQNMQTIDDSIVVNNKLIVKQLRDQGTQTDTEIKGFIVKPIIERKDSVHSSVITIDEEPVKNQKRKNRSLPAIPVRYDVRKINNIENIRNWFRRNDTTKLSTLTLRGRYPDIAYIDEPYYVTRDWQKGNFTDIPYYPFFEAQTFRYTPGLDMKPLMRRIYLPTSNELPKKTTIQSTKNIKQRADLRNSGYASRIYKKHVASGSKLSSSTVPSKPTNNRYTNRRYVSMESGPGHQQIKPKVERSKGCCRRNKCPWCVLAVLAAFIVLSLVSVIVFIISVG